MNAPSDERMMKVATDMTRLHDIVRDFDCDAAMLMIKIGSLPHMAELRDTLAEKVGLPKEEFAKRTQATVLAVFFVTEVRKLGILTDEQLIELMRNRKQ